MAGFTPFLIVGAGVGINTVNLLSEKKPVNVVLASGVVFGLVCVAIDDATKSKLGTMLAVLFLISSFITHGVKFINVVTAIANSAPAPTSGFTDPPSGTGGNGGGGGGSW